MNKPVEVILGAALAVVLMTGSAVADCGGDCNADHEVTVDDILTLVNIALDTADVTACSAGDANQDREITVDEILAAVNFALGGCPASTPQPTTTPSRTPTVRATPSPSPSPTQVVCNLSGLWRVTTTEDPYPPETDDFRFAQDAAGNVTIVGFPAFRAHVEGTVFRVDFCDCDPEELGCTDGDLQIATDCKSIAGQMTWIEFSTVSHCDRCRRLQQCAGFIDSGTDRVQAVRLPGR